MLQQKAFVETQEAWEDGGQLAFKEEKLSKGRRKLEHCLRAKASRKRYLGDGDLTSALSCVGRVECGRRRPKVSRQP